MESQNPQPKPMMDVAPPKAPAPATPPASTPDSPAQQSGTQTLKVHAAPAREEDDGPAANEQKAPDATSKHEQVKTATSAKTPHPVREIVVLTVLVMIILCGLAVLVYINA